MTDGPILQIDRLNVTYPDGRRALQDVSLRVGPGEAVALLGANGAGKSSLLLAVVGVLTAEGRVLVDGIELGKDTLPQIRRVAQLVFQDPNDQLFTPVVQDDVAFGPLNFGRRPDEVPDIVARSLESVGLAGFQERSPHALSMGERKRAAIATALACEPRLLLMDEPSSGLDPRGKRELARLLMGLRSAKLIATHDIDFARAVCGSAVVLASGRAVASGPLHLVLSDTDLMSESGLC